MKKIIYTFFVLLFSLLLVSCGNKTHNLREPSDIKYDGNYITWSEVANADAYEIAVNGGEVRRVSTNRYGYKANGKSFYVEIKAISNNENILIPQLLIKILSIWVK